MTNILFTLRQNAAIFNLLYVVFPKGLPSHAAFPHTQPAPAHVIFPLVSARTPEHEERLAKWDSVGIPTEWPSDGDTRGHREHSRGRHRRVGASRRHIRRRELEFVQERRASCKPRGHGGLRTAHHELVRRFQ